MTFLIRRLPWALLAGSVAFNLAFLLHPSSGLQVPSVPQATQPGDTSRASHPGDGGAAFERHLALDEQQKRLFAQLRNETRENAKGIRQAMITTRKELLDLMASDSSDPGKVDELIKQDAELGRQLRVLAMEHTVKLMHTLSPQQRTKLLEILRKRELSPMHGFGPSLGSSSRPFAPGQGSSSRPIDPDKLRHWHEHREQTRDSHSESSTQEAPDPGRSPQTQPAESK